MLNASRRFSLLIGERAAVAVCVSAVKKAVVVLPLLVNPHLAAAAVLLRSAALSVSRSVVNVADLAVHINPFHSISL
jgi:hypothetical protein